MNVPRPTATSWTQRLDRALAAWSAADSSRASVAARILCTYSALFAADIRTKPVASLATVAHSNPATA
jgi:hypothetical protein